MGTAFAVSGSADRSRKMPRTERREARFPDRKGKPHASRCASGNACRSRGFARPGVSRRSVPSLGGREDGAKLGRERAARRFGMDGYVERMVALYRHVLDARRRAA